MDTQNPKLKFSQNLNRQLNFTLFTEINQINLSKFLLFPFSQRLFIVALYQKIALKTISSQQKLEVNSSL